MAKLWWAIKENVPEPFENPKRFLIQKTTGIYAINFFIAPILFARFKDAQFRSALRGLSKLGPNFWLRKNKSGARRFGTGMSGSSNLAQHLRAYIKL